MSTVLYTDLVDTYHKHVITGNLDIVANKEIKTLLIKSGSMLIVHIILFCLHLNCT